MKAGVFLSLALGASLSIGQVAFAAELETAPGVDDVMIPPIEPGEWQGQFSPDASTEPDVLIVYTDETIAANGGTEEDLLSKLAQTDQWRRDAYPRSAMAGIQPGLTYAWKWEGHVESANMSAELSALTTSPEVGAKRDEFGADIVAMVGGHDWPNESGICGIAWLLPALNPAYEANAFSVTALACTPTTYAHEIGHNMGCMHDPDNSGSFGIFNYSFGHRVCTGTHPFRDIMSYPCNGVARIQNYSNPDVDFEGQPTGTWAQDCSVKGACRDCAQTIEETAPLVASYRERPGNPPTSTLPPPPSTSTTSSTSTSSTVTSTTVSTTTTSTIPAVCGNGIREEGEQCDGAQIGGCKYGCTATCQCEGGKPGWGRGGRKG